MAVLTVLVCVAC